MGAVLAILSSQALSPIEDGEVSAGVRDTERNDKNEKNVNKPTKKRTTDLPPLSLLPQEVAIKILSNLTATELCLAGCVISPWTDMTEDDLLWFNLVKTEWKYAKYVQDRILEQSWQSFKKLYLVMDEAQLIFSVNPLKGIEYLQDHQIVSQDASDIALYLHTTKKLRKEELCTYLLQHRPDVLEDYVKLEDYSNQSVLPNVLRNFLLKFPAKKCNLGKEQLGMLLLKFSLRYSECNPQAGLSQDIVYNICCSLMLLGYDFTHPLIKNKMSKREFIRNTREVTPGVSNDYLGHMYDNIYLIGPVVR